MTDPSVTRPHGTRLATRSGVALDIRPTTEADEAALAAFFDKVSDEDRRFRFFTAGAHVSHEQLDPFIHADHIRSESFLAFDAANGELVASGLLACDGKRETAEVAISIRHDYRARGLGWVMLGFLGDVEQTMGVRQVIAIESRDNHAAIELERESGFVPQAMEGDPTTIILTKRFA